MRGLSTRSGSLPLPMLFVALLFSLVLCQFGRAQQCVVTGTSGFAQSTTADLIVTYSTTEISYCPGDPYGVYGEAFLYQDDQLLADSWTGTDSSVSVSINWIPRDKGGSYILHSTHYVQPLSETVDEFGITYSDPLNFIALQVAFQANPEYKPLAAMFVGNGASTEVDSADCYLGTFIQAGGTSASLDTSVPVIMSITPSGAALGSSGTLTVSGTNLVDPLSQDFSAAMTTGTGVALTVPEGQLQSPTQITLNYTVLAGAGAARGKQNLAITTRFGTSAATSSSAFTIGDPTPVIKSVSPGLWTAGAAINFTISGTGFGAKPQIYINAADLIAQVTQYSSASDNGKAATISGQATVVVCPIGGLVPVTVTSKGYDGNGFIATPGNSDTATLVNAASTVGIGTIAPQIMFQGANIAGNDQNPQPVVVGQQVALTPSLSGVPMACVTNQTWALDGDSTGLAVGGYVASNQLGCVDPFPIPAPQDQCGTAPPSMVNGLQPATLYWIPNAAQTGYVGKVKYQYTALGQTQPVTATAAFSVSGPTNLQVETGVGMVQVVAPGQSFSTHGQPMLAPWGIVSRSDGKIRGVEFYATSVAPSNAPGKYVWVQLIPRDRAKQILNIGEQVSNAFSNPCDVTTPKNNCDSPELDTGYPYPYLATLLGAVTQYGILYDTPWLELGFHGEGEEARSFYATTYLMWDPNLLNSMPVPLGTISWSACGDAINTLQNSANWSRQSCSSSASNPQFMPGMSYPTWTDMRGDLDANWTFVN